MSYTVESEISYPASCIPTVLVKHIVYERMCETQNACYLCCVYDVVERYVIGRIFVTTFVDVESGGNSEP